jgi:hypothetical protein
MPRQGNMQTLRKPATNRHRSPLPAKRPLAPPQAGMTAADSWPRPSRVAGGGSSASLGRTWNARPVLGGSAGRSRPGRRGPGDGAAARGSRRTSNHRGHRLRKGCRRPSGRWSEFIADGCHISCPPLRTTRQPTYSRRRRRHPAKDPRTGRCPSRVLAISAQQAAAGVRRLAQGPGLTAPARKLATFECR